MSNTNGSHDPARERAWWGPAQEVDRLVVLPSRKSSKYDPLIADALLRLEMTPRDKAIMYPFETKKAAESAASMVRKLITKRFGRAFAVVQYRTDPPALYVSRGKDYRTTK